MVADDGQVTMKHPLNPDSTPLTIPPFLTPITNALIMKLTKDTIGVCDAAILVCKKFTMGRNDWQPMASLLFDHRNAATRCNLDFGNFKFVMGSEGEKPCRD